ncbi:MAG: class I SAM-dependent methyltransferase [Planctomycetes bacterium]|nr:class I SAM-dependent methyltransferase [Planctomycetota bacterium]
MMREFLAGLMYSTYLRATALKGRQRCPLCGHRVPRFLPLPDQALSLPKQHGWPYASTDAETFNATGYLCPFCNSADRHRLYALYVDRVLSERSLRSKMRVVDFGPPKPFRRFMERRIRRLPYSVDYRTADLRMDDVDDRVDITQMPIYDDDSCELFICSHILEHVCDDRKALAELHRILAPEGRGVVLVPIILTIDEIDEDPSETDTSERYRRFGQDDHVRLYSKKGFLDRLREAGFSVHELGVDHFGTTTFDEQGISRQSVLYVVEKS